MTKNTSFEIQLVRSISRKNIHLYKFLEFNYNHKITNFFQSLKCRSGNQQVNTQFQKVLKTCRDRYTNSNTNNENSASTNENSSESDSASQEEVYDKHFFYKNDDGLSYNQSTNNHRYR